MKDCKKEKVQVEAGVARDHCKNPTILAYQAGQDPREKEVEIGKVTTLPSHLQSLEEARVLPVF